MNLMTPEVLITDLELSMLVHFQGTSSDRLSPTCFWGENQMCSPTSTKVGGSWTRGPQNVKVPTRFPRGPG